MSFNNPVVGGENGELVRASIQSPDYVTGVSGWTINRDGSAEFNNVVIRLDLTTGSIIVGAPTGPQIVIRISLGVGLIQLPTNQSFESTAPEIRSNFVNGVNDYIFLALNSGFTGGNGSDSALTLYSGDDGTGNDPIAELRASGPLGSSYVSVHDGNIQLDSALVTTTNELTIATSNISSNAPARVISGRVNTGTNTTTLVAGTDTEITNTASTNTRLENNIAYRVDVKVQTRSSVGTAAVGTQRIDWKLWDGAVGGTQLDATLPKYTGSVGNNLHTTSFSFLFKYTGTTGTKTVRLSGNDAAGADTKQVQSNASYCMIVTRLGDPAKILNL